MTTKRAPLVLGLAAVAALTLLGGAIQGRLRYRWGPPEALRAAVVDKLEEVPAAFGGPQNDRWQRKSSGVLADDTLEMLECWGYILRTYENRGTGELVSVSVLVGPVGPISVHSPEICYSSQNYVKLGKRQPVTIQSGEEQDDQFWALTFKAKTLQEDLLRVYYAWTTNEHWSAPEEARFAFLGSPYLYKIQLATELPAEAGLKDSDTCREFLRDFLPVLRPHLIAALKH